jgi:hypothetical protein
VRLYFNRRSAQEIVGVQKGRSFNFENCGTLDSEFQEKCHLGCSLVANHREYYNGEGDGFPQVRAAMSFVNPHMSMIHPCTKSVSIMH